MWLRLLVFLSCLIARAAIGAPPAYRDGHARPLALAFDAQSGLLWVALSTADAIVAIDPRTHAITARVDVCAFPTELHATPRGILVSCRFDPDLALVERRGDAWHVRKVTAGPERGHEGLAVHDDAVYVAAPPLAGVKLLSLAHDEAPVLEPTGISPRRLILTDDPRDPHRQLLLVSNFMSHTITVHGLSPSGSLTAAEQTIHTGAPVKDMLVVPGRGLLLLTHEDRPIDRGGDEVHGLDSVALLVPFGAKRAFDDPGPGARRSFNFTERKGALLAKLDAVASSADGRLAIVGAATDNVLVMPQKFQSADAGEVFTVGTNPSAVVFLPDGRIATADRLSDTVTFVDAVAHTTRSVVVGDERRSKPWELGELLFYSRALVPNNKADGPLSVYACSACHEDGHIDGRLHAARHNRFRSMTKTCRGLADTAPYLSLGEIDTLAEFSDNIISTHAQGRTLHPDTFDKYTVELTVARAAIHLPPEEIRSAMTAYLARIPPSPSPFPKDPAAKAGAALFMRRCARCHTPPTFTSKGRYDVGTPVLGDRGNNPPSLRGVWDAGPYFSDGSASTLDELLQRTNPTAARIHAPENAAKPFFSESEHRALLAFLRSL